MTAAPAPNLAEQFFTDAMSPAFRHDPYPHYEAYRTAEPLLRMADTMWFSLAHADVTALLRDPRLSSDERRATTEKAKGVVSTKAPSLLFLDPPDHTRLRSLVARAFTPRRVQDLRAVTEAAVAELLDGVVASGSASGELELIGDLAYPLPMRVICALLGVPETDEDRFRSWSRDLTRSLDPSVLRDAATDAAIDAADEGLRDYFGDLVGRRRSEPGDDLLSALIAVESDGDRITAEELVDLTTLLLVAGHETTVNLIGNGMLALLGAPDQLALLRSQPDLVAGAVDELLRFDAPVQLSQRIATEDLVVAGRDVQEGDEIVLVLGAANRDPSAFADPHRLDVTRDARRHVSFGGGIHACLGAALARMEAQVAFDGLLQRFSTIELAAEPVRRPTFTLRGLETLPLRVG